MDVHASEVSPDVGYGICNIVRGRAATYGSITLTLLQYPFGAVNHNCGIARKEIFTQIAGEV